ncbi:MAG: hypothetical protein Q9219_006915 [cf. Caloplaca sp. 3 TL-2023]
MSDPNAQKALEIPNLGQYASDQSLESEPSEASFNGQDSIEVPLKREPRIVYKVQYKNIASEQIVYTIEDHEPISADKRGPKTLPILELITDLQTSTTLEKAKELQYPPQVVASARNIYLKINSPAIINALQQVVEYYPGQDFSGTSVTVPEPFAVLVHHESELASFREMYGPDGNRSQTGDCCEREKNTYEHLAVLDDFLKQRVGVSVETERQRYERGFATFDMLWMLLRPGITVYCDSFDNGNYNAYVIESVTKPEADDTNPNPLLDIAMWCLDFNGESIGRRGFTTAQKPFNGEQKISTLEVVPCEFWEERPAEIASRYLREHLEQRGKMFLKLTSRRCMNYDGLTISYPRRHYKGLVMADSDTYFSEVNAEVKPRLGVISDGIPRAVHECYCTFCLEFNTSVNKRRTSKFSTYDNIFVEKTSELTAHQYLLCWTAINAYIMKARCWGK